MEHFILLSLALVSDAMVMDEKVKSGVELATVSANCNYDAHYKDHTKYWCRGYFRDSCNIIAFTPNSTNRVVLKDTGSKLIITVSCLVKEDTGWYWCGIQRDFARDDMDFTQLIVTDNRGDPYVKVSLMCDGRRLKKRKTSTKRNTLNPVYNEAIVFDVPPESIDQIHLSIAVMDYDRVGHNEVIGVCQVGNEAERLGRDHWSEMLSYPRKPIAHWHSLMEKR